jgi:hypothetical protein
VLPSYTERYEVPYAVWREMGVPTSVLVRAGLGPTYQRPVDPERVIKPRYRRSPEFLAEVQATFDAAGGDEAGIEAVMATYDWTRTHARHVLRTGTFGHPRGGKKNNG